VNQRAAAEEVAAERLIVVVIEQVRDIGADRDVFREPIGAVHIENAVARNRSHVNPCLPGKRIPPIGTAVNRRPAADRTPLRH